MLNLALKHSKVAQFEGIEQIQNAFYVLDVFQAISVVISNFNPLP